MKFIFISILLLLSISLFADNTFVIEDFKSSDFKDYFYLRETKGDIIFADSMNFARITYPKWKVGMDMWPTAIINYGKGNYTEKDFGKYKYLYFLVYNEYDKEIVMNLLLCDDKNNQSVTRFNLKPKDYTLCMLNANNLNRYVGIIDPHNIVHFDFWILQPRQEFTLRLGSIVISDKLDNNVLSIVLPKTLNHIESYLSEIKGLNGKHINEVRKLLLENKEILLGSNNEKKSDIIYSDWLMRIPYKINNAKFEDSNKERFSVYPVPTTLNLEKEQMPIIGKENKINLYAAKGEGESYSFIVTANNVDLNNVEYSSTDFIDDKGNKIIPELKLLGYVPIKKPTPYPYGFGLIGNYPDPLLPNEKFSIKKSENQTLLFTAWVPSDAISGVYKAVVKIKPKNEKEVVITVSLKVYNVTMPKTSYLKSYWCYWEGIKQKDYYDNYTEEKFIDFIRLNRKYRMNLNRSIDYSNVFIVNNGVVTADWTEFDKDVEYLLTQGQDVFNSYITGFIYSLDDIKDKDIEGQKVKLFNDHIVSRGWKDFFYVYAFDEPATDKIKDIKDICDWYHKYGKDLNIILTDANGHQREYIGYCNIIVPHVDYYNMDIAKEVRDNNGKYWQYTCIGTLDTNYPDSWKIDNYGTSHRALGWWLYKYKSEGYLYWGVDYLKVNPWVNPETWPNGNGDGSMYYPALDRKSLPYPSLRCDIYRDADEDYNLLYMLDKKYPDTKNKKILDLLNAKDIIYETNKYNYKDDMKYYKYHKNILDLLEKN